MRPVFSVLIATYNQAGYLRETLDSVACQTFEDYELVIVDDGSTDDTEAVISEWIGDFGLAHPNRVLVRSIANSGQCAAMEYGFELCSGEYICLLDSDDRWLPQKLSRVYRAVIDEPRAGMIMHPLHIVDAAGQRTGELRPKRARLSEGDIREQLSRSGRHVAAVTSGVVIKAEVFRQLVPMPTKQFRAAADGYLTFGAGMMAPVHAIHEPLAEYRMHPSGDYLRTVLSPEALRDRLEMQLVTARHFGVSDEAMHRNSWFARGVFALSKFDGDIAGQFTGFGHLARATLTDPAFGARDTLLLLAYWTLCLVSPRRMFEHLWREFQIRHTGFDRIDRQVHEHLR